MRELAALAHDEQVDAVVVCGNVFADIALGADTAERTWQALAAFAPHPVVLIAGETDPALPFGIWQHMQRTRPDDVSHVHLVQRVDTVQLPGIVISALSRPQRAHPADLTTELQRPDTELPWVVATHGGSRGGPHADAAAHRVQVEPLLARGAAWVALGGKAVCQVESTHAWPGTPAPREACVPERGTALLVTLGEAEPQVRTVELSATWDRTELTLTTAEQAASLPPFQGETELTVRGQLPLRAHAALRQQLSERSWTDRVRTDPDPDLVLPEFLLPVVAALLEEGPEGQAAAHLIALLVEGP